MIQTNNESKCSNKEKVICLALYLMVLTTPASSFHNVIIYLHQKYSHNGYGQSYLTASSLTLIVGFFFSPFIIKKIKLRLKTIMRICSILSIFYTLVPALFTIFQNNSSSPSKPPPTTFRYLSQIVANIVNSLSFSIYLVLEGMILSYLCAGRQQSQKSKYFSLYNGILMIRNICAPIFTYFTLGIANQTIYYFVGTFITLFSVLVIEFIGIQQNLKVEDITENYDPAQNKQMKTCLKQYYEGFVSMKKFIPLNMLYGLVMGFVAGSFSHLLPKNLSSGEKDNEISLALLSYGIGCIIGSYLFGFIFPKFKNKKTWKIICMFFIIAFLVEIYCLQNSHQFMFVPIIIGFLFGIALIMVNCFMLLTVTLYFEAKAQCFALVKQTRLIFYITYQWLVKSISSKYNMDKSMTIECILLILLSLLSFYKAIQFYSQKIKFQPQIFVDEKQLNNKTQTSSIQIKNIKKNSQ